MRTLATNRQGLKQNYVIREGALFEDFENVGDWTLTGAGATKEADIANLKTGSQSLKIGSNNAVYAIVTKNISQSFVNVQTITFWIYIHDKTKLSSSGTTSLYISSATDLSKSFSWVFNVARFRNGWNKVIIDKSEFTNNGSESWDNLMVRIRFRFLSVTGETAYVSLDNLMIDEYYRPKVILTFDDGRISQYSEGFAYMSPKGFPGILYLSRDNLDTTGSYVTTADVDEMYADNWDISLHGAVDISTLETKQEVLDELELNQSILREKDWTRRNCHKHYAYPNGGHNDITDEAFNEFGLLTGRTILTDTPHGLTALPPDNLVRMKCGYIVNTTTLATVKARVDSAIKSGHTLILVFHSLVTSPSVSTEWAIADFRSLIDYIKTKKDQGYLDVVTISEWYDGLDGRRNPATNRVAASIRTTV